MTDEKQTVSLFSCTGEEDVTCICGKSECTNNRNVAPLENLSHKRDEHKLLLHQALKKLDCATVCQLLHSGMQFCFFGKKSCISIIAKYWTPASLDLALTFYPSAINCEGPKGETLLMMCDTQEKFQVVLDHGADVDETNDDYENVLLYIIKHRLRQLVKKISKIYLRNHNDYEYYDYKKSLVLYKFEDFLIFMVNSRVDVNAEDIEGQTALQLLLQIFKPGCDFLEECTRAVDSVFPYPNTMCSCKNEIASFALFILLQSGARLPFPDQHGRTPLMLAVQSPFNLENMKIMIEQGVDVNAVDRDGNNAIHYILASPVQDIKDNFFNTDGFSKADQMVSFLLDSGCQMQGTDILLSEKGAHFKVVNYLMARDTSTLKERNFSLKQEVKNDSSNVSFLSLYLYFIACEHDFGFQFSNVSFIKQEIESGLDVSCGKHLYAFPDDAKRLWMKKLSLPFSLFSTIFPKLRQIVYCMDSFDDRDNLIYPEVHEANVAKLMKDAKEHYLALDAIQKLLLPFWSHTPLALLLFVDHDFYDDTNTFEYSEKNEVLLLKALMQFLYDVGGPLSPGTEIYHGVMENLRSIAVKHPAYGEVVSFFDDLHSEVPSLLQLARNALRANLKKTDTRGLDVSSLRVLCQGKMRPLPLYLEEIINFKNSSVSVMVQDVPMILVYDGFEGAVGENGVPLSLRRYLE